MQKELTYWDGEWKQEEPPITIFNRAFRYGDGAFESIRFWQGKAPFLSYHIKRLEKTAVALKMKFPNNLNEQIVQAFQGLSSQQEYTNSMVRVWLFRSGGGKYTPNTTDSILIMKAETTSQLGFQINHKGLTIDIAESVVLQQDQFSSLKTMNSLPYVMASIEKEERGFDDLILLNKQQELVETCSSNLFLVKQNRIYTPFLSSGALDGVMRKVLFDLAKEAKFELIEQSLKLEALRNADELFVTNAVRGIQWVKSFRNKRYFHNVSTQLAKVLLTKV